MIKEFWKYIRFFTLNEFDSPDTFGSGNDMNEKLIVILDMIRYLYGKSLHINSGIRTPEHNKAVGGVEDSAHLTGEGVDIRCETSGERWEIVTLAIRLGIKRIGIGKSFVHLDVKNNAPQGVIWMYN